MTASRTRRQRPLTPSALRVEDRRALAWDLRLEGLSQAEIALRLGVDRSTIARDIRKARDSRRAEAGDDLRQLEADRLDQLQQAVWNQAREGDVPAVHAALAVLQRRAQLEGLDKGRTGDGLASRSVFMVLIGIPEYDQLDRAAVDAAVEAAIGDAVASERLPVGAQVQSFVRLYGGVDLNAV